MSKKTVIAATASHASQGFILGQFIAQLKAFEASLELGPALGSNERRGMAQVVARCPSSVIEQVCAIATQNGGAVLGVPYNPDGAREVVAYAAAATPLVIALRGVAQRVEDDMLQREVQVADKTRGVLEYMKSAMRTDEGKSLAPEYAAMRAAMVRKTRKPGTKKTKGTKAPSNGAANNSADGATAGASGSQPAAPPASPPPAASPASGAPAMTIPVAGTVALQQTQPKAAA